MSWYSILSHCSCYNIFQTALLREVLSQPRYHVLHFDLRISGFADLSSLYMHLSIQMQQFFEEVVQEMEGYEEFRKEVWDFEVCCIAKFFPSNLTFDKRDRTNVQNRLATSNDPRARVRTSDVARLIEMFQVRHIVIFFRKAGKD